MTSVTQHIREAVWDRRGVRGWAGWLALQPASAVFASGVALKNLGYRIGLLRAHRAKIPVVSVGNLSVGGTGKTPMTLWLARQLAARLSAAGGGKVAILLRGYGGRARTATLVSAGAPGGSAAGDAIGADPDVETAGDEAVMLAKSFDGVVLTA